jgi:heparan-alpha-glucosaminide N-acetyltransferase
MMRGVTIWFVLCISANLTQNRHTFAKFNVFNRFMILVNNAEAGGGPFAILEHAAWNGVTIADFVMPSFLFMVGMAIPLALKKVHGPNASEGKWAVFQKVLVRAGKLVGLGLLLHFPHYNLKKIRIPGVLQRIGFCYLLASSVVILVPPLRRGSGRLFAVFTNYLWYWIVSFYYVSSLRRECWPP